MVRRRKLTIAFIGLALASAGVGSCAQLDAERANGQSELLTAATEISSVLRANIYDPHMLATPAYRSIEKKTYVLAKTSVDRESFVRDFNKIWRVGPFSHVNLSIANSNAEDLAKYLDNLRVGEGAVLSWRDNVAVLTVNTMMGIDTVEQIDGAFVEIEKRGANALIIDLRENEGGAFAVRPLVGHLIDAPLDAGAFVSQKWYRKHSRAPKKSDVVELAPWQGWSIISFWDDVRRAPLTRTQFEPIEPIYNGPVFVLTSSQTASAAELATDALAADGRSVVIGERTAGKMLSQKPFDISAGMQLFLPIADYHAWRSGHIEGNGIAPDIETPADRAMEAALSRISR